MGKEGKGEGKVERERGRERGGSAHYSFNGFPA